ncbi:MAG: diaminopimelate aminotransferase [Treponema sp. CETP13]|nr:MAG: diaminopimelate aminotransferase [Treponema sp. CETP13]
MNIDTVTKYIDNATDDIVELETNLNRVKALAPESGGDGEAEKCKALEKWLTQHGISHFERFDAPDSRVSAGIRPNLVATIEGENTDFSIWVMAHLDVVPSGNLEDWNTDPWTVVRDGDKLYGRGVEDNQQGLCSAVFAALAFVSSGIKPAHTVKLLFVADEEYGSAMGIQYLLREHTLFNKRDYILIPDGGDKKGLTVEVAEKNILWLKLTVKGKQSHGSMPDEGNNAMIAGCDLALRLNDMENKFTKKDKMFSPDYSTFQPTKKENNVETVNIIPGQDVFYMDCRILPCYTLDMIREEVNERITQVEKKYGVSIKAEELQAESSPATPVTAPVVVSLCKAIEDITHEKAKTVGIGGGTVASYLRNAGFDAVVWSTLDETMHQPNEYCKIENLKQDAKILASLFLQK